MKKESPHSQLLPECARKKAPVPWVQVYKLPEFVWFSYKVHAIAECARCYGTVAEREVITMGKPITMVACTACHDEHKASNECNLCHNQAQNSRLSAKPATLAGPEYLRRPPLTAHVRQS